MVGPSLYRVVRSFYKNGYLLKEINKTIIILIPKCRNPIGIHQFRPISLYNFAYKVISKTMVNRLKSWMYSLISNDQNAFISG